MNDSINRKAAIEKVRQLNAIVSPISDDVLLVDKAEVMTELMILPSAEEIIRCKDCKHLFEDNKCPLRTWWTHIEDDFCSYAERRADE